MSVATMPPVDWKRVGEVLRKARERTPTPSDARFALQSASLRYAAKRCGIDYHKLWRLERGETRDGEAFLRVCKTLELDPFEITGLRQTEGTAE